jgi:hypothetical protein
MFPLYAIWLPMPGLALAGFGLASSNSRRRKLGLLLLCLLLVALLGLQVACGGGGSSNNGGGGGSAGTPAGTYNVVVTATSGALSHQTTFVVTVQ